MIAFGLGAAAFVAALSGLHYAGETVQSTVDRMALTYAIAGVMFSYIAWAFWRYLTELDDLSRRIQLEAIALTYLTGLGAFSFLAAFGYQTRSTVVPLWFIALELVRGFWLWRLARRY